MSTVAHLSLDEVVEEDDELRPLAFPEVVLRARMLFAVQEGRYE